MASKHLLTVRTETEVGYFIHPLTDEQFEKYAALWSDSKTSHHLFWLHYEDGQWDKLDALVNQGAVRLTNPAGNAIPFDWFLDKLSAGKRMIVELDSISLVWNASGSR